MVIFPWHQNEESSVFLVARSEKRGRGWFKKGVGINYSTQETCRTSGYCLGLVSILVMYWQTPWLISLNPGVIKKAGPTGAYRFLNNCPLGVTDKLIMFKKIIHSCAFTRWKHMCEFMNNIVYEIESDAHWKFMLLWLILIFVYVSCCVKTAKQHLVWNCKFRGTVQLFGKYAELLSGGEFDEEISICISSKYILFFFNPYKKKNVKTISSFQHITKVYRLHMQAHKLNDFRSSGAHLLFWTL